MLGQNGYNDYEAKRIWLRQKRLYWKLGQNGIDSKAKVIWPRQNGI